MSQFRDGSLGRFSNQEGGIPVCSKAALTPDFGGTGGSLVFGRESAFCELMLNARALC